VHDRTQKVIGKQAERIAENLTNFVSGSQAQFKAKLSFSDLKTTLDARFSDEDFKKLNPTHLAKQAKKEEESKAVKVEDPKVNIDTNLKTPKKEADGLKTPPSSPNKGKHAKKISKKEKEEIETEGIEKLKEAAEIVAKEKPEQVAAKDGEEAKKPNRRSRGKKEGEAKEDTKEAPAKDGEEKPKRERKPREPRGDKPEGARKQQPKKADNDGFEVVKERGTESAPRGRGGRDGAPRGRGRPQTGGAKPERGTRGRGRGGKQDGGHVVEEVKKEE
jgi:hypothetical protein